MLHSSAVQKKRGKMSVSSECEVVILCNQTDTQTRDGHQKRLEYINLRNMNKLNDFLINIGIIIPIGPCREIPNEQSLIRLHSLIIINWNDRCHILLITTLRTDPHIGQMKPFRTYHFIISTITAFLCGIYLFNNNINNII